MHSHKADRPITSQIRAVIFDYGDVISLPRDPAVLAEMATILAVPEDKFRESYDFFRHDYDRGSFLPDEYWRRIAERAGVPLKDSDISRLREADVKMWGRLNHAILNWAGELRAAGFKTAVLSNMHHDMIEHIRANGEWARNFDCLTLSSSLRMAKPEPAIFKHCLNSLHVEPHESLFLDDREPNVEAAKAVGIWGILAVTPQQLKANLKAIGFTPLPE